MWRRNKFALTGFRDSSLDSHPCTNSDKVLRKLDKKKMCPLEYAGSFLHSFDPAWPSLILA